jgi:hypothetical protein
MAEQVKGGRRGRSQVGYAQHGQEVKEKATQ